MNATRFEIPGLLLIAPKVFEDDRGFFMETYHAERYAECGLTANFVQDNHSRSAKEGHFSRSSLSDWSSAGEIGACN